MKKRRTNSCKLEIFLRLNSIVIQMQAKFSKLKFLENTTSQD